MIRLIGDPGTEPAERADLAAPAVAAARVPYVAPTVTDLGKLSTLFRGNGSIAQDSSDFQQNG